MYQKCVYLCILVLIYTVADNLLCSKISVSALRRSFGKDERCNGNRAMSEVAQRKWTQDLFFMISSSALLSVIFEG